MTTETDRIVPWGDVREGDSALHQGVLAAVESAGPPTPSPEVVQWNVRLPDGRPLLAAHFADDLTAVRSDTGPKLSETERWQVNEARDMLARWDGDAGPRRSLADQGREMVLADHVRALLAITDQLAPQGADDA
jgi:hypothetical protein